MSRKGKRGAGVQPGGIRPMYYGLALVLVAGGASLLGASSLVVFILAGLSLIPVAALIGEATEQLALWAGPRVGGLLNATFGNAAELIITIFALAQGPRLFPLVKASLTGSIIGNSLLVLGMACVAGGLKSGRKGRLSFNAHTAGTESAQMLLAVVGLMVPAIFALTPEGRNSWVVEELSIGVAIVLILSYIAGLAYGFRYGDAPSHTAEEEPHWSRNLALGLLLGATLLAVWMSHLVVGTVESAGHSLGLTTFFVGVVIVPIIGNAAEHFTAIVAAARGQMDLAMGIAVASSTQIALLVAPLLVFVSLALGHPMNYVFTSLEVLAVGVAAGIVAYISLDGEATWLEGIQLLATYVILAVVFFFLHV